jgi:hypothetical protein
MSPFALIGAALYKKYNYQYKSCTFPDSETNWIFNKKPLSFE